MRSGRGGLWNTKDTKCHEQHERDALQLAAIFIDNLSISGEITNQYACSRQPSGPFVMPRGSPPLSCFSSSFVSFVFQPSPHSNPHRDSSADRWRCMLPCHCATTNVKAISSHGE